MATQSERIAQLEAEVASLRAHQPPRVQFGERLATLLEDTGGVDGVEIIGEADGPLGGRSYQIRAVFTDARGKDHGVIVNAYVGEPDVKVQGRGERRAIGGGGR